ncbi:GDP-mannose 4,6-dehydratase [Lacticigenium naphthae]|uniref:GDP-mannose 4,6-dehydratase n=1 Tax=Lacticigenium naphthae TaxID=515351 RepID=UPI000425605F|nr:GDP-mannose 4,6-dehydratase [Lacticigenium naphthae]
MNNENILITGVAGFIGSFLAKRLLESGNVVIGVDNLNDYYDTNLKESRLNNLQTYDNFKFIKSDISKKEIILDVFKNEKPTVVINLAAQAGVRYSIVNPDVYMESNVQGFFNILEACRKYPVKHLIYASSSSVYGNNKNVPFKEEDRVDYPVSLYAASKKTNEMMAYTYSHLYNIPTTGLRFFTVYGPMGRPDMAYFGFTDKFFNNEPIAIYNNGDFENDLYRDFTYVDDIVEGVSRLISLPPSSEDGNVPSTIFNIGNNNPVKLMDFISTLENALSKSLNREVTFQKVFEPMKPGDVPATYASIEKLNKITGFKPQTPLEKGLQKFTDWYVDYYKKK